MLIVISPAKKLDFTPPSIDLPKTPRRCAKETAELEKVTRQLSRADLRRLMSISEPLADLNYNRFQAFDNDAEEGTLQAVFAFAGDVYEGLKAREMSETDLMWAQDHLRILSGFYGLLRPLDGMLPYRLEMGTKLKTPRGNTLYDFWGERISERLNEDAQGHTEQTLINLASQEYFGAVDARALKLNVVTPHFKERKDGVDRIISFHAKKARGAMTRYIIENRLEKAEDIKIFDLDGYRFDAAGSTEFDWIFIREGNS
ncbi:MULTISPECIES: peroxide stress protein YaaA [unclassified Brevundimonas]|uniref:peroxide stress protein YaaA n=1 Tax=unclassified Brevundimonas TaxID=2622653 RepID=UPI0025BACCE2|nr:MULTISPECIES: peroxide stress protein YaaA [unclassified Brevundimonas]